MLFLGPLCVHLSEDEVQDSDLYLGEKIKASSRYKRLHANKIVANTPGVFVLG